MNAQNIFFILADIFMVLAILIQVALIVLVIAVIVQVRRAEQSAKEFKARIEEGITSFIKKRSILAVVPLIASGISWFRNRKK